MTPVVGVPAASFPSAPGQHQDSSQVPRAVLMVRACWSQSAVWKGNSERKTRGPGETQNAKPTR